MSLNTMNTLNAKLRPLMQRAIRNPASRSMTVLSKESGEEFKKLVGDRSHHITGVEESYHCWQ